jgi:hypothetical protein
MPILFREGEKNEKESQWKNRTIPFNVVSGVPL